MLGSNWHPSKQMCIVGQVIRMTCNCTTTDLQARDPLMTFIQVYRHKLSPQKHNHSLTAVIYLRPASHCTVMLCDRLVADLPPGRHHVELRMWPNKSLHEIKIWRVTCNPFMTTPIDIWGYWVNYDHPAKTCDQRRIQVRVGLLASEIDKFHDRFCQLKEVVDLVNFNGE